MATTKYTPRLAQKYKDEVVPALSKKFGYKSVMQTVALTALLLIRN
jgi:large subunit ribosomal protein L5